MAIGFLLFHLKVYVLLFLPTHGCYFLPSSWWHMLGNRASPQYLSGKRRRKGGICMLVSILLVGRRR